MKKVLRVLIIAMLAIICYATVVNAASGDKIVEYAKKGFEIGGKTYKVSDADLLKIKTYFTNNAVTAEQENQVIEKADKIIAIMKSNGVADANKLPKSEKQRAYALAQEAGAIVGINVTYDSSEQRLVLSKDGVKIDAISLDNTKLVQTGMDYAIYLNIAVVAVIAVATIAIKSRKTRVNA